MTAQEVVMSWSGGKDSALALHQLRNDPRYEVVGLLTTVSDVYDRVSHHGVRVELLHHQAEAIGIPPSMASTAGRTGRSKVCGSTPGRMASVC